MFVEILRHKKGRFWHIFLLAVVVDEMRCTGLWLLIALLTQLVERSIEGDWHNSAMANAADTMDGAHYHDVGDQDGDDSGSDDDNAEQVLIIGTIGFNDFGDMAGVSDAIPTVNSNPSAQDADPNVLVIATPPPPPPPPPPLKSFVEPSSFVPAVVFHPRAEPPIARAAPSLVCSIFALAVTLLAAL